MTDWKQNKKPEEITPFVEGWDFVGTLGEGAFGEVRLVVNSQYNIAAAAKIICLDDLSENTKACINNEVKLHKYLRNKNIIRYFSDRYHAPWNCRMIFMEYASGGELFDKLKPDVGIPEVQAQNYFKQLLQGVAYIHRKGFCHRDIKPENILFDKELLKIIDFGHATPIYSKNTQERKVMNKICGTVPYMAPEIWRDEGYYGQLVDIWSCGLVLIAMLSGDLPWAKAVQEDKFYKLWCMNKISQMPWTNVSIDVIALSKKILTDDPSNRLSIKKILETDWLNKSFSEGGESFSTHSSKRLKLSHSNAFSQPEPNTSIPPPDPHRDIEFVVPSNFISSSQPVKSDDILMATIKTQSQTQKTDNELILRIPRMTRIGLNKKLISREEIIQITKENLDNYKAVERYDKTVWRFAENVSVGPLVITVSIFCPALSPASISDDMYLVDFARSRGDCIQFRKVFRELKKKFLKYEVKIQFGQQIQMESTEENTIQENDKENLPSSSRPSEPTETN